VFIFEAVELMFCRNTCQTSPPAMFGPSDDTKSWRTSRHSFTFLPLSSQITCFAHNAYCVGPNSHNITGQSL